MTQNQQQERNKEFWVNFLKPLTSKKFVCQDECIIPNLEQLTLKQVAEGRSQCLCSPVLEELERQKSVVDINKKTDADALEDKLVRLVVDHKPPVINQESAGELPSDLVQTQVMTGATMSTSGIIGDGQRATYLQQILSLVKDIEKAKNRKSHQQTSASQWTIDILSLYIGPDQVNLHPTDSSPNGETINKEFPTLQVRLTTRINVILGEDLLRRSVDKSGLCCLRKVEHNEAIISLMVLEIISFVCESSCNRINICLKPEEALKGKDLPGARADYMISYKGVDFGIVEVKTPQAMKPNAVAQLLMSLLKLQHQDHNPEMQYVGILTDSCRYILVKLQGSKFTFESEDDSVVIHPAVTWVELCTLCKRLHNSIERAIENANRLSIN